MSDMTKEKAMQNYAGGIDCSQVVFAHGAELLGFDQKTAKKIAAAFGGGMFAGERCGCVTGALMAIGLKYGTGTVGGIVFAVGGINISLSGLAIAALVGILMNAVLPGKDYEFGANEQGDTAVVNFGSRAQK